MFLKLLIRTFANTSAIFLIEYLFIGNFAQNIGCKSSRDISLSISKLENPGIMNIGGTSLVVLGPCDINCTNSGFVGAFFVRIFKSSNEFGNINVNSVILNHFFFQSLFLIRN